MTGPEKRTTKQTARDFQLPNTARMYDYYLGGTHNTEADRAAADAVVATAPFTPFLTRTHRACLKTLPAELARRGSNLIIDLASGLPTQDHLHFHAPAGTAVVYADLDPVVVEYARDILGDTPDVYYFHADMRQPEQVLNQPDVQRLLSAGRKPSFVTWGIGLYLSDDELSTLARTLYAWADVGTVWAFNATLADMNLHDESIQKLLAYYADMNEPLHIRTLEQYRTLVAPWQPDERGFVSIYDWHGIDPETVDARSRNALGPAGGGYGALLVK